MENSYIVLGNGFSIDLVQKMEKAEEIDLANLFSKGEHVLYPKTNTRGFLSRKYTPDLWNLGARTYMSYEAATQLVTDVITCANVYNLSVEKRPNEERDSSNIYIHAYSELSSYLRYLFIYYDSLVSEKDLKNIIDEIELIHYIKNRVLRQKKVYIITYNYDVFLERLLKLADIPFSIYGFDDSKADVILFKPHGSISFSFKIKIQEYSPYNIRDAILVCAWNKQRFVDALLNIGQNVGNSFEYDKTNHMATYIFPIGLTIVYNGNHSSLSGILKGEGTIQANQTYDLVPTYDYMYFDGIYFRNKINDEKLYKVERFEIGALYEIGRLLAENGIR